MTWVEAQVELQRWHAQGKEAHIECVHTIDRYWYEVKPGPDQYAHWQDARKGDER